jgi:hypothetical protein
MISLLMAPIVLLQKNPLRIEDIVYDIHACIRICTTKNAKNGEFSYNELCPFNPIMENCIPKKI